MNTNDIIGTIGVGLILIAYLLSTFRYLSSESRIYYMLNLVGAGLACYASWLIDYWPFVILEGVWTVVSLVALIRTPEYRTEEQKNVKG